MESRTVLQYQLLEKIGSGGMGEVYKAQDTRLNRIVAIKVLPADKTGEADRRRRFFQEAQAASALNHPNIITIHDIISEGGTEYMVMEYVGGKTLLELIPQGGLRVPQVLQYSLQMADALKTAHAAGIIHRDLKPGNVMVKESGLVKILDFGLAKLTDATPHFGDTETVDAPLTVEGSIIGTVSYMSPEQAQGKRVDVRSDIFSFGSVLYEMITGVKAFDGGSNMSTLFSVVRDESKPIASMAPDVPPQIEQVISRCLRKDPDARWQSMQEVHAALSGLKHQSDSGVLYKVQIPEAKKPASKAAPLLIIGLLLAAVAGAGGWWWTTQRKPAAAVPPPVATTTAVPEPAKPSPLNQPPTAAAPAPTVPTAAVVVLTNDGVLEMVKAKVPASLIVKQIRSSKTNFDLSTAEVIRLSKAGVPEPVIEAMRNPKGAVIPPAVAGAPGIPPTQAPPQTTAPANHPAVTAASPVPVPDGLPFRIVLTEDVPANAEPGKPLRFTVSDGLKVSDVLVVAKGASVTGVIAEAGKKKFLGMGGKLALRLLEVQAVDGQKLVVRATPARRAGGPAQRPVEVPGGVRSREVAAAAGTQYIAYIDGGQVVTVGK